MLNAKSALIDHRSPVRPVMIARFHLQPQRRILPDVRCDLVWIDEKLMFSGPVTQARLPLGAGKIVAVASFNPLVVKPWLRVPLRLLVDQFVPVSDVAPDLERPLADHFAADATAIVLPAMAPSDSFREDERIACALRQLRAGRSVQAASAAVCLSTRQLERQFVDQLGLSPKLFSRILRFRRAVCMAKNGTGLASAAASAGYSDQAHFSHDARAFAGQTPGALLRNIGNAQEILFGNPAD